MNDRHSSQDGEEIKHGRWRVALIVVIGTEEGGYKHTVGMRRRAREKKNGMSGEIIGVRVLQRSDPPETEW